MICDKRQHAILWRRYSDSVLRFAAEQSRSRTAERQGRWRHVGEWLVRKAVAFFAAWRGAFAKPLIASASGNPAEGRVNADFMTSMPYLAQ
jgi:EAL domain-containing protein (putative c-di-GMP-specific phosphodiesterase class I)